MFSRLFSIFSTKSSSNTEELNKIYEYELILNNNSLKLELFGDISRPYFYSKSVIEFLHIKHIKKFDVDIDYVIYNKDIYFTYDGLLRAFYIYSNSKLANEVKNWYEQVILNKQKYAKNVHEIFSKFDFPCIYLLFIGSFKGYNNVYKFGRTENFCRRYKELNKKYDRIFEIVILQFIDPEYLSQAETEVHHLLSDYSIKIENYNELVMLINPSFVIDQYKLIGKKFLTTNKNLQREINELQYKNKILELENKLYKHE
jgi:hypothetical protein